MRAKRFYAALVAVPVAMFAVISPLAAQELPGIKLHVREVVPGDLTPGPFVIRVPAKCDSQGHVYVRYYQGASIDAMPIVKISPEGRFVASFAIKSIPGFEKGALYGFAVDVSGKVYLLAARTAEEREVVKIREDGKYDSSFKLDPLLEGHQLTVFPSGELLVSGEELSPGDRKPTGRPLLALYDRGGKFLGEITKGRY